MGIEMKCGKATKLIEPFIDGELDSERSEQLQAHLISCSACESRVSAMRATLDSIASLPAIEPTARESYRLMNRVRAEMDEPRPARIGHARLRLTAAAAVTILVAASIGTTWVVLSGGGTVTKVEVAQEEQEPVSFKGPVETSADINGKTASQLLASSVTSPSVTISGKDYAASELKSYRNDLGARLDFYASYWYPAAASGFDAATLANNQATLTTAIADQAAQAGKNPDEVKNAVSVALSQCDQTIPLLPCYAEQAKVGGKDAWLISMSGPEDYLLFKNQELPSAMFLASQGGGASLMISQSLLTQLASMFAPVYGGSNLTLSMSADANTDALDDSAPLSIAQTWLASDQQQQFQTFLRQLAAQSNNVDLIAALEGLNYDQLLMLLQGNWNGLAAQGIDLTKFLVPPKRLYAIDATTGNVIW